MNQDLETSPLLGRQTAIEGTGDISPAADGRSTRQSRHWTKWTIIFVLFSILVSVTCYGVYFVKHLPSHDEIEKSVMEVSNWEIEKVHIDGWRKDDHLDTEGGDALQLSVQLNYWPDYESWILDNGTALGLKDKTFYRSVSENLVRTVCLSVNNATTFDGVQTEDNMIGILQVKDQFCLDLHDNVTTALNLTVLIEPRMDNILRVLKKIWFHEYDKLNLSSILDLSVTKQAGRSGGNWRIPLARLRGIQINWKKIIDWGSISDRVHSLRHHFDKVSVRDFSLRDSDNGFLLEVQTDPLPLPDESMWLESPQNITIPSIDWDLRLPDCKDNFTISLPSVSTSNAPVIVQETIDISVSSDIKGPLPRSLLQQVCWSDEENAVTPMTLLFKKVLNASELVTVEIRGRSVSSEDTDSSILPHDLLETLLHDISYFPITTNLTVESGSLIQEVTIDKLKARWVRTIFGEKKLRVSGTIRGTVALPFYRTSKEMISVDFIKGETRLFHQDVHFLSIPMRYWTKAGSKVYKENDQTMMELSLSVRDDEVQIVNNFELTRVLNEVLFKGESPVHLDSNLDIMMSTPLGEMVLMGLNGEGNTTLRS